MPRGGARTGAGRKRKSLTNSLASAIERAKDLTERMLDELAAVTSRTGELEDMIVDETADDEDGGRRRAAMLRAIELPSRASSLKQLVAATRAWADLELRLRQPKPDKEASAPAVGKKQQAQVAADTAGIGTDWGDDLDATSKSVN